MTVAASDICDAAYDVIVIGGGPAGSTTAALLAEYGHRVLLLERESMPRYHVGESLIPYTWHTLKRLGVIDQMHQSANPKKYSVQFVSLTGQVSQPFYFFQTIKHECAVTWQVQRSEFDTMLLDNARAKGAEIQQGRHVRDVLMDGNRVVGVQYDEVGGRKGLEARSRCVVDCSGRDSLLSRRFGWRERDPELNKIAVWSYYKGARRDPGLDAGATTVAYVPHKGWFWYIPLPDDVVSVGVVGEADYLYRDTRDVEAILDREVQSCKWVHEHVRDAERCEPAMVTGEYSYSSSHIATDGLCLVGDAFSFLDPLFSSGVFLALKGGEIAADTIHQGLLDDDLSGARFDAYLAQARGAVKSFRELVLAFYDESFSFREFLDAYPHLHSKIVDTLVGNVFTDLDPLYTALAEFKVRTTRDEVAATSA
jgi:flavin-dependent dehydrogenase